MEWVTGVKLTGLPSEEIRRLVATGQEAFLTQLLEMGFFHGDPHPGNLLKVAVVVIALHDACSLLDQQCDPTLCLF